MNYKSIRTVILDAAKASGIQNANQFRKLCVSLGISGTQATVYYNGKHDMSGGRTDKLAEHFGLEMK